MNIRTILIALGVLLVVIVIYFFVKGYITPNENQLAVSGKATINNHTFKIAVARTSRDKQIGLSGRTSIPDDEAMLFPFDKPDYYSFWMKQMKFPIDIIYINGNKVVTVHKNVQPPQGQNADLPIYRPDQPADKVLEIKANLSDKYNIKPGDTVAIEQ